MENKEIKPCPFCGGEAIHLRDHPFYELVTFKGRRAVICKDCSALVFARNNEEAKDNWNRRAAEK